MNAPGVRPPKVSAVWLGLLAIGCGRAHSQDLAVRANSEPGREESSTPMPDAGPARDEDAGAPPQPDCPAPGGNPRQGAEDQWARNPSTGDCCRYGDLGTPPTTWPRFSTEDACQNDCRCASVGGQITPRPSMECICSVEVCPSSIGEAEQLLCNSSYFPPEPAVQRLVGCGLVVVIDRNGFSGIGWVFEQPLESTAAAAPRLVGSTRFSDEDSQTCSPFIWSAGPSPFECEEWVSCQLCGDSPGPEYPPCE